MPSLRTAAIALAIASGTLLLAALAITLHGHRHELDWGNVPTWFAGLFAVIASGISLRNYLVARASFEHNTAKHEDDLASQARLVVIHNNEYPDGTVELSVKNHSDSIIFDVDLDAYRTENDGTPTLLEMDEHFGYNPDDYVHQTLLPDGASRTQVYVNQPPSTDYVATFVDARGIRWRRTNKGQPKRVFDTPTRS